MALAFKVAGNSSRAHHGTPTTPLEKRYVVFGFWPRYEVGTWSDPERTVIWGRKALKTWEVSMRMEGYKKWKNA